MDRIVSSTLLSRPAAGKYIMRRIHSSFRRTHFHSHFRYIGTLSGLDLESAFTRMEPFFLHRLHLDIMVYGFVEEMLWNFSFRHIARYFRSLRYLHIGIEQRPSDIRFLVQWHFQNPAHCTFLKDLPVLRNLKLRTATVTVADDHFLHSLGKLWTEDGGQYRWSMAQKQEWAAYVTRILLHQEERGLAAGEGI